ncbi:hypothetical protein SLE2022_288670 [Rubroshorea leprosula]
MTFDFPSLLILICSLAPPSFFFPFTALVIPFSVKIRDKGEAKPLGYGRVGDKEFIGFRGFPQNVKVLSPIEPFPYLRFPSLFKSISDTMLCRSITTSTYPPCSLICRVYGNQR